MSVSRFGILVACLLTAQQLMGFSQQRPLNRERLAQPHQEMALLLQHMQRQLNEVMHEVRNHEVELRTLQEKHATQEISFDDAYRRWEKEHHAQQEATRLHFAQLQERMTTLERTLSQLETLSNALATDLRQMRGPCTEALQATQHQRDKIVELDRLLAHQRQGLTEVESALHAMMELWQAKEEKSSSEITSKHYIVQPGDTLQKIARQQHLSVDALRQHNQLTSDRIVVGQSLKLP